MFLDKFTYAVRTLASLLGRCRDSNTIAHGGVSEHVTLNRHPHLLDSHGTDCMCTVCQGMVAKALLYYILTTIYRSI